MSEGGRGAASRDRRAPDTIHRLRRLNAPAPVEVRAADGLPRTLLLDRRWRAVARVEEVWRIEDGWWRPRPVARTYYRLLLEGDRPLTVYRDDLDDSWWTQRA